MLINNSTVLCIFIHSYKQDESSGLLVKEYHRGRGLYTAGWLMEESWAFLWDSLLGSMFETIRRSCSSSELSLRQYCQVLGRKGALLCGPSTSVIHQCDKTKTVFWWPICDIPAYLIPALPQKFRYLGSFC